MAETLHRPLLVPTGLSDGRQAVATAPSDRLTDGAPAQPPPVGADTARAPAASPADASLAWHGEDLMLGIKVRAFFFEPPAPDADIDPALRSLPIFADRASDAQPLKPWSGEGVACDAAVSAAASGDSLPCFQLGPLQARPSALWWHGDGLISVWTGGPGSRPHDEGHWRSRLPAHRMIESLACALVVAGHTGRPTAAVLRAPNALYQFDPGPGVLAFLIEQWPAAWQHARAERPAGASARVLTVHQFASFCEPRLRDMVASARRAVALRIGE